MKVKLAIVSAFIAFSSMSASAKIVERNGIKSNPLPMHVENGYGISESKWMYSDKSSAYQSFLVHSSISNSNFILLGENYCPNEGQPIDINGQLVNMAIQYGELEGINGKWCYAYAASREGENYFNNQVKSGGTIYVGHIAYDVSPVPTMTTPSTNSNSAI